MQTPVEPPAIIRSASELGDLAHEFNAAHTAAETALRRGLEHARAAGELLLRAKERCRHGGWLAWLRSNVHFSERTAQGYMRISRRWDEIEAKAQGLADLTFEGGLQLLATSQDADGADDVQEVPVAAIRIGQRTRQDLGDLDKLAASIARLGLLEPIIVTSDHLLVVGRRRLEAVRLLGWEMITAYIRDDLDPVIAEGVENSCRKAYEPDELADLERKITEASR